MGLSLKSVWPPVQEITLNIVEAIHTVENLVMLQQQPENESVTSPYLHNNGLNFVAVSHDRGSGVLVWLPRFSFPGIKHLQHSRLTATQVACCNTSAVKRGKIGHLLTFKSKLKILRSIFCGLFRQKSLYELWDHCLQSLNHCFCHQGYHFFFF